jgi:hypothetical protein
MVRGRGAHPTPGVNRTPEESSARGADEPETPSPSQPGGVSIPIRVATSRPSPTPATEERPRSLVSTLHSSRTASGEHMVLLRGLTLDVEWKVAIFLTDGTLTPVLEFSKSVPHDHPAVLQAYGGLLRCIQEVLGAAWSEKAMCPSCHLPTSAPSECDCCDQRMCQICRARHSTGNGVPGTVEPSSPAVREPSPPAGPRRPSYVPGYG